VKAAAVAIIVLGAASIYHWRKPRSSPLLQLDLSASYPY